MSRTYSELVSLPSFEERFRYLSLRGTVGRPTFGTERWMNQQFYKSREWRTLRNHIIVRDNACDLGIPGYEIGGPVYIHHLNPMEVDDIVQGNDEILDPEFLISVTHQTHNAIHYGDENLVPRQLVERFPNDHAPWLWKE